jgi:multisubunit Na+/H+ antiporter MnhG subunit
MFSRSWVQRQILGSTIHTNLGDLTRDRVTKVGRTTLFSRLLQHTKGNGGSVLTRILTGFLRSFGIHITYFYPNIFMVLVILILIPVTAVKVERSSSMHDANNDHRVSIRATVISMCIKTWINMEFRFNRWFNVPSTKCASGWIWKQGYGVLPRESRLFAFCVQLIKSILTFLNWIVFWFHMKCTGVHAYNIIIYVIQCTCRENLRGI